MTAVIGDTDVENFTIEELDKEIPCDSVNPLEGAGCPYDASAKFHIKTACCGTSFFICEDCLFDIQGWVKKNMGRKASCVICETRYVIAQGVPVMFLGRLTP